MAGRKKRKTVSPLAAEKSINGLPLELLELILSKLTLKWNVHASLVCKRWQAAALSVRVVNLSDVLDIVSAVGRKVDFLNYKVDVLSGQVDSLFSAVAESDRKWSSAFEELRKELNEVKHTQSVIMSKSSERRTSSLSSALPSNDDLVVNLEQATRGSNSDPANQLGASPPKRTSRARSKRPCLRRR